jgi:hypothetical protein
LYHLKVRNIIYNFDKHWEGKLNISTE